MSKTTTETTPLQTIVETPEDLQPVDETIFARGNGMSVFKRELPDGNTMYFFAAWSPSFTTEIVISEHFYDYLSLYKKP